MNAITPRQYPDLHDHLERLERAGLLVRIGDPVCKDQEMHPLVRWQFRGGIKEKDRNAFLFEKPTDATGKTYDIPVAIGILAANRQIYGIGLGSRDVDAGVGPVHQLAVHPHLALSGKGHHDTSMVSAAAPRRVARACGEPAGARCAIAAALMNGAG